jgi:hypothetical protein
MSDTVRTSDQQLEVVVYVSTSPIHGMGLFAVRAIDEGEYIGTFFGPEADEDGTHVLWVYDPDDHENAVGRVGVNVLRYLNHALPCNAYFDGFDLYADCLIARDKEITIDYGDDG